MTPKPMLSLEDATMVIAAVLGRFDPSEAAMIIRDALERGVIGLPPAPVHATPAVQHALSWSASEAVIKMRFSVEEIGLLASLLGLPDVIVTPACDRASREEALVCRRLAEPCRWIVLQGEFHRSEPALSRIFAYTVKLLATLHGDRLRFAHAVVRERVGNYCQAIANRGSPLTV